MAHSCKARWPSSFYVLQNWTQKNSSNFQYDEWFKNLQKKSVL